MSKTRLESNTATGNPPVEILDNHAHAEPEILSSEQLLKRLPISRSTLRNWCDAGKIPYIQTPGRRILFDWPSVREALLRRQRGAQ